MGNFSDQFKNESLKSTVKNLTQKYKVQDVKDMSQNDMIKTVEYEKSLEKDEKTRTNYDMIIEAIKEFFAKKFSAEQAKAYIREHAKNEALAKLVLENLKRHPELEQIAKQELGKQFVEDLKKSNAYVKRQSNGWVKSLN